MSRKSSSGFVHPPRHRHHCEIFGGFDDAERAREIRRERRQRIAIKPAQSRAPIQPEATL